MREYIGNVEHLWENPFDGYCRALDRYDRFAVYERDTDGYGFPIYHCWSSKEQETIWFTREDAAMRWCQNMMVALRLEGHYIWMV